MLMKMNLLPDDLQQEILNRVPLTSVIAHARLVNRHWKRAAESNAKRRALGNVAAICHVYRDVYPDTPVIGLPMPATCIGFTMQVIDESDACRFTCAHKNACFLIPSVDVLHEHELSVSVIANRDPDSFVYTCILNIRFTDALEQILSKCREGLDLLRTNTNIKGTGAIPWGGSVKYTVVSTGGVWQNCRVFIDELVIPWSSVIKEVSSNAWTRLSHSPYPPPTIMDWVENRVIAPAEAAGLGVSA